MGKIGICPICKQKKHLSNGKYCQSCIQKIDFMAKLSLKKAGYKPTNDQHNHYERD